MGKLSGNARNADNVRIVQDESMARDLCRGTSFGWPQTKRSVLARDRDKPCCRCGTAIRWDLKGPHPLSPSIDHLGTKVADVVGMQKGAARKLLHDGSQLAVSHFSCNSRDSRGYEQAPTQAVAKPAKSDDGPTFFVFHGLEYRRPAGYTKEQFDSEPWRQEPIWDLAPTSLRLARHV